MTSPRASAFQHVLNNRICAECNQINFNQIFNLVSNINDKYGILVAQLGNRPERGEQAPCSLCRLFSATKLLAGSPSEYHLRALSVYRNYQYFEFSRIPKSLRDKDNVFLVVLPGKDRYIGSWESVWKHCREFGFICRTRPSLIECTERIWGRTVPMSLNCVDYQIYQSWLSFCRTNHKDTCKAVGLQHLQGFRLIDCGMRSIVLAPYGAKYAALSYVWGHSKREMPASLTLPAELPKTIEDAILVTKCLNLRYLWVDKYCIKQDSHSERKEQINAMGNIYREAEITLIAANGDDENAGLAGVTSVLREEQPFAQIGIIKLVSTMRMPGFTISASKWNKRAWTYQEAILSRRKLVFTKDQAYYECRGMFCYESLSFPLRLLHRNNSKRFRSFVSPSVFSAKKFVGGGTPGKLAQIRDHIFEYTARSLTRDSDSLEALLGVLNQFQDMAPPIYHFWGLPVGYGESGVTNHFLVSSLNWFHNIGARRKPSLPSWSWAGWEGQVFPGALTFPTNVDIEPHISLKLKKNGSLIPLEKCDLTKLGITSNVFSSTLHLEAYFLSPDALPSVVPYFSKKETCYETQFLNQQAYLQMSVTISDRDAFLTSIQSRDWEFVYLGFDIWGLSSFMIIQWQGTIAEKVGIMLIRCSGKSDEAIVNVLSQERRNIILV